MYNFFNYFIKNNIEKVSVLNAQMCNKLKDEK